MEDLKDYFTIKEFANLLRVHTNTIYRCIKNGKISAIKLGTGKRSAYRICRSELNRLPIVELKEIFKNLNENNED